MDNPPIERQTAIPVWQVMGILAASIGIAILILPDSKTLLSRQIRDGSSEKALQTLENLPASERSSDQKSYALTELRLRRGLLTDPKKRASLQDEFQKASTGYLNFKHDPEFLKEVLLRIPFASSASQVLGWLRKDFELYPADARHKVRQALIEKCLAANDPRGAALMREDLIGWDPPSHAVLEDLVRLWRMAGQPEMGLKAVRHFEKAGYLGNGPGGAQTLKLKIDLLKELGRPGEAFDLARTLYEKSDVAEREFMWSAVRNLAMEAGRGKDLTVLIRDRALTKPTDPFAWRDYAKLEMSQGQQQAAIDALQRVRKIDPKDTASAIQLAQLLEWNGKPLEAFRVYLGTVRNGGGHVLDRLFSLNLGLYRDEELGNALRGVEEQVTASGHALEAAQLYLKLADYEAASGYYERLLSIRKDAKILREYGRMQASLFEFDKALANYQEAERIAPGDQATRQSIAEVLVNLGKLKDALAIYRSLATDTIDEGIMNQYITLAESLGELKELIAGLKQRLAQTKKPSPRDYLRLAAVQTQAAQLKESRATLTRGIKQFPRDPELILQTAYAQGDAGDYLEASKLLATHPELYTRTEVIEYYLSLLVQAQDFAASGRYIRSVQNRDALNTPAMLEAQAQIFEANKQLEDASACYEKLYKSDPRNVLYLMNHARMLSTLGHLKEAREVIQPWLEKPTGEILKLAAQVYGAGGDHKTAEQLQKRYLASEPKDLPEAWGFLGDILLSRGDRINARRAYRHGVEEMIKRVTKAQ